MHGYVRIEMKKQNLSVSGEALWHCTAKGMTTEPAEVTEPLHPLTNHISKPCWVLGSVSAKMVTVLIQLFTTVAKHLRR